jgi:hypothetical protein
MSSLESLESLEPLCDSILRLNKNIQSVAVISNRGRVIEKISKPKFTEQFSNYLSELFCMSCVLQVSMGRDFDGNYGPINYHISERRSLTMITFPLDENVVLVTTNKNVSPVSLASKTVDLISEHRKRF